MATKLDKKAAGTYVPWFIWDLRNFQLITSPNIPMSEIKDTKQIVLSEAPIPGLNFNPVQDGGRGNRKISFTLPIIKRNSTVGNMLLLKQYENLRNMPFGLQNIFRSGNSQFAGGSKVLFFWGTGASVPLEYFVAKCDFSHNPNFVNRFGHTQYTLVEMELWLDENSDVYEVEETFRKMASFGGQIQRTFDISRDLSQDAPL